MYPPSVIWARGKSACPTAPWMRAVQTPSNRKFLICFLTYAMSSQFYSMNQSLCVPCLCARIISFLAERILLRYKRSRYYSMSTEGKPASYSAKEVGNFQRKADTKNQYLFRPVVLGILYSLSVFTKSKIILGLAHRGLYQFSSFDKTWCSARSSIH